MKLKSALLAVLAALFISSKAEVFCPICEKTNGNFWSYGVNVSRENAVCPNCYSLERHRHFWLFLQNEIKDLFQKDLIVLHWAPEACLTQKFKELKNLSYIGGDIDRHDDPDIIKLDITDTILRDNSVDVVICNHVLEHIPNDRQAMSEILRVLRPGGHAIIMVPLYTNLEKTYEDPSITNRQERLKHFDQEDHVRKYCPKDLEARLKSVGFKVDAFPLKRLSNQLREKYGLAGYDDDVTTNANRGADIFLCQKK